MIGLSSSELRDFATVAAAIIALLVFVYNSRIHRRNQQIENLARFFEVHRRLLAMDGFLMRNFAAIQAGRFVRDPGDEDEERRFHVLLLQVEQLAILANNEAVPDSTQVYMFGLYARHLMELLTEHERQDMFWELAISYLQRLCDLTAAYERMTPAERLQFQR
jgi:hypothetical protein